MACAVLVFKIHILRLVLARKKAIPNIKQGFLVGRFGNQEAGKLGCVYTNNHRKKVSHSLRKIVTSAIFVYFHIDFLVILSLSFFIKQ